MKLTLHIALSLLLTAASAVLADDNPLPAFPGAEGFGAVAVGGRGGRVIHVTNLNADGPGSLAEACAAKGPRIVVFDVGGVITTKNDTLEIEDGHITIAGQTAPSPGITVVGELSTKHYYGPIFAKTKQDPDWIHHIDGLRGQEMIIRFLRMRPKGPNTQHSVRLVAVERLILDHVSGSWGVDEDMDFSVSRQFTVQWCGIEPSAWDGPISKYRIDDSTQFNAGGNTPHCYGMIMGYTDKGNASLHHNLFTHHNRRTPLCGLEVLDERNNVMYDVAAGIMFHGGKKNLDRPGQPFRANVVANYFKCGPSVPPEYKDCLPDAKASAYRCYMVGEAGADLFAEGNYDAVAGRVVDVWKDNVRGFNVNKCLHAEKPWPAPPVATQTAEEAYKLVLAQVGCLPRDAVSTKAVEDTRNGTGLWGRYDPEGGLTAGLPPAEQAPPDTDRDGMPDAWEKARGLNPDDPTDGNKVVPAGASPNDRHKGYTYIEYYINERADRLIEQAMKQAAAAPTSQPDGK
ncbi:MAG: hypothetical protein BIFFINMI_01076 [Phycisphaerae bacterium]|nr:hypothetical protein [Phycisphaerae bacterium]